MSGPLTSPQARTHNRRWLLLPILFFSLYLALTVAVFAFGPWPYPVESPIRLYVFLAAAQASLFAGYLAGLRVRPATYYGPWSPKQLVKASVIVNLVLLVPTIAFRTGGAVPDLVSAFADPGAAYTSSNYLRETELPVVEYIRFFFGPILAMLVPLTVFYWRSLTMWLRTGAAISICGISVLFVAMGTNKALADFVLVVPAMLVAAVAARTVVISRLARAGIIAGLAVAATMFVVQFAGTQASRPGSASKYGYFTAIHASADLQNFMVSRLPESAQVGVLGLTSYMSQGYYAVDLALSKPFVPMYGAGNSMFLFRQVARFTGDPSWLEAPYPVRIEVDGWSGYGLFSSIYPWIASDVGFPGTIVVVFAIGFFFAMSWRETLQAANPFAVTMFAQFVIMLFYFSANNQLLQSGEGWSAFWVSAVGWWWTRKPHRLAALKPRRVQWTI
jgi:hypothetical protein